jgi:hypothetical protein
MERPKDRSIFKKIKGIDQAFLQQSLPVEQTPSLQQSAHLPSLHFSQSAHLA